MKARAYVMLLLAAIATTIVCLADNEVTAKKRQSQSKPNQNAQLTREQIEQRDHQQVCNILGFAANIFGNFVQLVSAPNSRENVGAQVGNMAENMFHIVSEAAKSATIYKSGKIESPGLEYLQSEQFKKDLTEIIQEQLKTMKS